MKENIHNKCLLFKVFLSLKTFFYVVRILELTNYLHVVVKILICNDIFKSENSQIPNLNFLQF